MDRRFVAEFAAIERLDGAERARAIRKASTASLMAALSGSRGDGVLRNAIGTKLLNRSGRAPFLGAAIASLAFAVAAIVIDWIDTGTLFVIEGGPHAYFMEALTLAGALISLVAFLLWRGRWPRVSRSLTRLKNRNY